MKHSLVSLSLLFCLCIFVSCYSAQQKSFITAQSIQQKSFIIDQSGILDSLQINKLNTLYINHEKNTKNQIVLLTTDSFYPDSTIESYASNRYDAMGIGRKDVNNGVLIVFCKPMRQVRITRLARFS